MPPLKNITVGAVIAALTFAVASHALQNSRIGDEATVAVNRATYEVIG